MIYNSLSAVLYPCNGGTDRLINGGGLGNSELFLILKMSVEIKLSISFNISVHRVPCQKIDTFRKKKHRLIAYW